MALIFSVIFFFTCWYEHNSYWRTIYNVQTIDINILHNTLPLKIAALLQSGDKEGLNKIVEINNSRFGILITDYGIKNIIAQNKFCSDTGTSCKTDLSDSSDDVVSSESKGLARIFYFRSIKPVFLQSFTRFLSSPIKSGRRNWNFFLFIYSALAILSYEVIEQYIHKKHIQEQLLSERFAKFENEYNIILEQYDNLLQKLKAEAGESKQSGEIIETTEAKLDNSFERLIRESINRVTKHFNFVIIKHNFTIREGEIDHLLICRHKSIIFILEDKGYSGLISGNVNSSWNCQKDDGRKYEIKSAGRNPYLQVRKYVMGIIRVLEEKGIKDKRPQVIGIVVFPNSAVLSGLDLKELPGMFSVITVNELNKTIERAQRSAFGGDDIGRLREIFG